MNQSNSSKQILLSVIGVAILVVAVVGVSFAFFNYTRTGAENTVKTGTIVFETNYTGISVTNLFPVSQSAIAQYSSDEDSIVGVTTIDIKGYTTYANGLDFVVTASNVNFDTTYNETTTVDNQTTTTERTRTLPVSVKVSSSNLGTETVASSADNVTAERLGGANEDKITVVNYEVNQSTLAFTPLTDDAVLAKGHIATNTDLRTNFGQITIKVYIDAKKVAISDTYNGTNTPTDEMGTTSEWVDGREVYTTEQWNSLSGQTGASFKIKIEANETPAS